MVDVNHPRVQCMVLWYILMQATWFQHIAFPVCKISPTMEVSLKTTYYYYYQPHFNSPSASCTNEFSSLAELYEYIDTQIADCYNEKEDFDGCHTGTHGQTLELVNMCIQNVYDEEVAVKIYDWNLSQIEVRLESRDQLEIITEIFNQAAP